MALNTIILQGRLCKDPDLRSTNSGKKVCTFTIAVDRARKNDTDYIPCVAWNLTAEFVNNYFLKGDPILVQGRLSTRKYDDRDGNKRTAYEVVVDEVNFSIGKSRPTEESPAVDWKDAVEGSPGKGFETLDDSEELPF